MHPTEAATCRRREPGSFGTSSAPFRHRVSGSLPTCTNSPFARTICGRFSNRRHSTRQESGVAFATTRLLSSLVRRRRSFAGTLSLVGKRAGKAEAIRRTSPLSSGGTQRQRGSCWSTSPSWKRQSICSESPRGRPMKSCMSKLLRNLLAYTLRCSFCGCSTKGLKWGERHACRYQDPKRYTG